MNPQVRALAETKGNGPVLRRGKNAGDVRETAPQNYKKMVRTRASLPDLIIKGNSQTLRRAWQRPRTPQARQSVQAR